MDDKPAVAVTEAPEKAADLAVDQGALVFEEVMGRLQIHQEAVAPKVEPWFTTRPFIGVACLVIGITLGKLSDRPAPSPNSLKSPITQSNPGAKAAGAGAPGSEGKPGTDIPFRELATTGEFDPLKPLNGGFPVPPAETQKKLAAANPGAMVASNAGGKGSAVPMDPFAGGAMPSPLKGQLAPMPIGGLPEIPNGAGNGQAPTGPVGGEAPVEVNFQAKLIEASASGDGDSVAARLQSIASANGGRVKSVDHMSAKGTKEGKAVLVIVPSAKFDMVAKAVSGAGVRTEPAWGGSASARQRMMTAKFSARLEELQDEKKRLLLEWQEDASPIKDINAAIETEARALSAVRSGAGSEKFGVILVMVRES